MQIVTLDLETWWSADHSLSKMSPIAYCMSPKTEIISLAIKHDHYPTDVHFGEERIQHVLSKLDWSDKLVVAHNMSGFDAMILAWRLGLKPKMWGCTLAMARPIHTKTTGNSLAKLVEHYGLGRKDNAALINTKGKRLADFTEAERTAMAEYNKADVEQCYMLFQKLKPHYSAKELWHIDATIRMLVEPGFLVDHAMLETALSVERDRKRRSILMLGRHLKKNGMGSEDVMVAASVDALEDAVRTDLASAPKFSALLESLDVPVPMKASPTNPDKQVPALAKTDEAFIALQDHDNEIVAAAARARLAVKSTLLETRIQAFLDACDATEGYLPVPLNYCGADTTGRWSGWAYNPQNLPRINPSKPKVSDALRNCLRAPAGHKVVVADLSGIELRVNHFLWKSPSVALFQEDPEADLYKDFASARYKVPVEQVSKDQRQMGKVCLAEGSLVLCKMSHKVFWCPIERFRPEYQLWDGKEWVWAQGVVSNGWRLTQQLLGLSLTPDHLVLSGTQWLQARYVQGEKTAQVLATGAANLSLRVWLQSIGSASLRLSLSATAGFLSTRLRLTTSKLLRPLGATFAPRKPQGESATGSTPALCQKTSTGRGCSIDYPPLSTGAISPKTRGLETTVSGVLQWLKNGGRTAQRFLGMFAAYLDGMCPSTSWTGLMSTGGTSPVTSGSSVGRKTCLTNDAYRTSKPVSQNLKHVYDILNCGPRNRFTVLTDRGPVIVHNCHLGLGFGAGAPTFRRFAKTAYGLDIPEDEAVVVVEEWRDKYKPIVDGWKDCGKALLSVMRELEEPVDPWGLVTTNIDGFRLPTGRLIRYPNLRLEEDGQWPDGRPKRSMFYASGRHKARITGPKADENIVQALARDIIADSAVEFFKQTGFRPKLTVHDELVYVVPDKDAQQALDTLQAIMRTPPKWWPELITWSEGDIADSYGAAK